MGIFSRPKKRSLIAVFDITSSSVGGILFQRHSDKLPEILTTARFSTDFFPDLEFKKFQRSLHKTFERIIAYLKKKMPQGRKKPDLAVIVFSSPYYISQTKIARLKKLKPFEITGKLFEEIISGEMNTLKKDWHKGQLDKASQTKDEYLAEPVEHEMMKVNLNGYYIPQPLGKYAQSLELFFYASLGIKIVQDKLKECISHSFGETAVRFQTFPFVAFSVIKNIIDITKGLLLVDIGGEISDLVLIRNSILEEVISFPVGENFLARRIASAFRFSPEDSLSLLDQYSRNDLHTDTYTKVKKIIEDAAQKWCQSFQNALTSSSEFSFPPQNFLFIGGKAAAILKDYALCVVPASSQFLLPEAFKNHFVFNKGFSENKDILLMISALFVDKLFLSKNV